VASRRAVVAGALAAAALPIAAAARRGFASQETSMPSRFAIYDSIIQAWKRKDIDAVLSHMTDDIVWHYAAAISPPVLGHAGARKFMETFGAKIGEVRWRVFDYAESGDRLFVEGVDEYATAQGRRVAAPYAGVLEFKAGRIVGWRDYVDVGVIARQQAGEPLTPQVLNLIDRPAAPIGMD